MCATVRYLSSYHVVCPLLRKENRQNGGKRYFSLFMQYRYLCTKSRHTMIDMSIYHACFKKYIHFPVFWCIFGFAKIKQYAVRPPSILYIFSKFLSQKETQLWIKMHLPFRVSTCMQNKRTSAQTDQCPCILH